MMRKAIYVFYFMACISNGVIANDNVYADLCDEANLIKANKHKSDLNLLAKAGMIFSLRNAECYDRKLSLSYLVEASNKGHSEAQFQLCGHYQENLDGINAYKWCYIAKENGHERANSRIIFFESQLPNDAIKKGRLLADDFISSRK